MEHEQIIQDYDNGKLTSQERVDFENRRNADPSFNAEVQEFQNLKAAIRESERAQLKQVLVDIEDSPVQTLENDEEISFFKKYRHIYVAAAVIIFAIIVTQFFQDNPTTQDLYASFYEPYPNTYQPVVRGDSSSDITSQGFVAYENKEFDKAVQLFDESLEQTYDPNIEFYKAMSLLNAGKNDKALELFGQLKKKNTDYMPQLYWYSALLALKNDNTAIARQQLDSLSALKSGFKERAILKIRDELK